MKWKNLEALLYLAIVLGVGEWSGRRNESQTDLFSADPFINRRPNLCRPNSQDRLRILKEDHVDQIVLDNILSWEESQKRGDWSPEQNLITLPLIQNSDSSILTSIDSDDGGYNSGLSSPNSPTTSTSSAELSPSYASGSLSVNTACPGSEELLGAVGYSTPASSSDDFEEFSLHEASSHVSNSNGVDQTPFSLYDEYQQEFRDGRPQNSDIIGKQGSKDLGICVDDDFEQFLKNGMDDFDPFATDISTANQLPESLTDTFMNIDLDAMRRAHGGVIPTLADVVGNIKTEEVEDLFLANLENDVSTDKMLPLLSGYESIDKDTFPDFTSYDDDLLDESIFETEKNIKKEKNDAFEDLTLPCSSIDSDLLKGAKLKKKDPISLSDLPYTEDALINMPVEKFNTILESLDTTRQLIAKDLRRKGKNKHAARSCRKRKIDAIDVLDTRVSDLEERRNALLEESRQLLEETEQINRKTGFLYDHIFDSLRDENGLPYSPLEYSLQSTSEGNVYLVPSPSKTNIRTPVTKENQEIDSSK